ncbi:MULTISPECIES: acetyl-CoA carboxylase biotin carboxyl carrier protein [unclassified Paenibacillus]|uniref:acetyl-CoA carboxylase biotin carboxyl carrier protein n=1 Tax=unclassified Paenibacillus TaxID=185978 RepID=UPI0009541DAA|nr:MULTISPECIES: acetyl-CoA carboxylase biotin carboxyl carrier protein [unclassified Paenibacillus]ASS65035.1 acetyl-CoA carboxylase biotin carboxyl carrier protein [Paenibacillus sp. RUD330]SIQ50820.1 acetyl-CoA carboxylase biotin carboxyl carrier protein [Paenibacillus sp. RU4X]SIQ72935.1 acetyl-CoA carboxylase biotin carboxyl carrier protein [Paenibacillus sp. RU4T]
MFKLSEIKELIKLIDQTSVQELEIENEGTRLLIRKPGKAETVVYQSAPQIPTYTQPQTTPQPAAAAVQAAPDASAGSANEGEKLHSIVSPMVGTFYTSSSPDNPPYVTVGSKVSDKSIVCILEAMKLMNELEAEVRGEIVEVLVENGQLVEYGQPLFRVRPE